MHVFACLQGRNNTKKIKESERDKEEETDSSYLLYTWISQHR